MASYDTIEDEEELHKLVSSSHEANAYIIMSDMRYRSQEKYACRLSHSDALLSENKLTTPTEYP